MALAATKFTQEEQQTIDRLRDKYSSLSVPVDPNAPEAAHYEPPRPQYGSTVSSGKPGANVDVHMCPICQGLGSIQEEYNHRRLEKYCTHCEGRGVAITRNGVDVTPPATSSRQAPAEQAAAKPAWAQDVPERRAKLAADLAAIDAKARQLGQERDAMRAAANEPAALADPQRVTLIADVVAALEVQLSRLAALRAKKEGLLQRYQHPDTLQPDDGEQPHAPA